MTKKNKSQYPKRGRAAAGKPGVTQIRIELPKEVHRKHMTEAVMHGLTLREHLVAILSKSA